MDARSAYEEWHRKLDVDEDATSPWHEMVKRRISAAGSVGGKRILEIACGRGGLTCWLGCLDSPPAHIVAIDFSAIAVQKGRAFADRCVVRHITWEVGDIQAIAHPSGSFDAVISCETIEHVSDPRQAIRELARVLKPGGRLMLTTPNYLGVMGLYRIYLRMTGRRFSEAGQPINNFMLLPMTCFWIVQSGLRLTAVDGLGHYLPIPRRPPVRISLLDRSPLFTKWLALHSFIEGVKPLNDR